MRRVSPTWSTSLRMDVFTTSCRPIGALYAIARTSRFYLPGKGGGYGDAELQSALRCCRRFARNRYRHIVQDGDSMPYKDTGAVSGTP